MNCMPGAAKMDVVQCSIGWPTCSRRRRVLLPSQCSARRAVMPVRLFSERFFFLFAFPFGGPEPRERGACTHAAVRSCSPQMMQLAARPIGSFVTLRGGESTGGQLRYAHQTGWSFTCASSQITRRSLLMLAEMEPQGSRAVRMLAEKGCGWLFLGGLGRSEEGYRIQDTGRLYHEGCVAVNLMCIHPTPSYPSSPPLVLFLPSLACIP